MSVTVVHGMRLQDGKRRESCLVLRVMARRLGVCGAGLQRPGDPMGTCRAIVIRLAPGTMVPTIPAAERPGDLAGSPSPDDLHGIHRTSHGLSRSVGVPLHAGDVLRGRRAAADRLDRGPGTPAAIGSGALVQACPSSDRHCRVGVEHHRGVPRLRSRLVSHNMLSERCCRQSSNAVGLSRRIIAGRLAIRLHGSSVDAGGSESCRMCSLRGIHRLRG